MLNRLMTRTAPAFAIIALVCAGCSEKASRLNAPPQGMSERRHEMDRHFATMAENAAKRDASLADTHFEPHSAELSGLGVWRITRIGDMLNTCGGIIRYETSLAEEELLAARLQSVRDFLAASGYDTDLITVEAGLSRNAGGPALNAIEARARQQEASAAPVQDSATIGGSL